MLQARPRHADPSPPWILLAARTPLPPVPTLLSTLHNLSALLCPPCFVQLAPHAKPNPFSLPLQLFCPALSTLLCPICSPRLTSPLFATPAGFLLCPVNPALSTLLPPPYLTLVTSLPCHVHPARLTLVQTSCLTSVRYPALSTLPASPALPHIP